jgi:hypothetical protein
MKLWTFPLKAKTKFYKLFFIKIRYKNNRVNSNHFNKGDKMRTKKKKILPAECISIFITLIAEVVVKILKKTKRGVRSWKAPSVK